MAEDCRPTTQVYGRLAPIHCPGALRVPSAQGVLLRTCIYSTQPATLHEIGLDLLVRNALFLPARFRDQSVPEIFQRRAVFFQIDLNGHLAALFIRHELDPIHILIVLQSWYRRELC